MRCCCWSVVGAVVVVAVVVGSRGAIVIFFVRGTACHVYIGGEVIFCVTWKNE